MAKIKDIEKINFTQTEASSHIKLNDTEKDKIIEIVLSLSREAKQRVPQLAKSI